MPGPDANRARAAGVDTHCHLFLMQGDPEDVARAAEDAGVGMLVCVGIDVDSSVRSVELARAMPRVFATAGVHPHTASGFDDAAERAIEHLVADPLVVGVGETGLDHYRELSPRADQARAFRRHIALARESGKPLVVHVREAWDDAMRVLEDERAERVVLHCFSGGAAVVREAEARGYFVSFAGNVTYPGAGDLRAAARVVASDRLLLETDSPFLAPQPVRGRPNEPANLRHTAAAIAEVRGTSASELLAQAGSNARRAFELVPAPNE